MTCKDCYHYKVCGYHIAEETDMSVDECLDFKDKSKIIELPCKVGDTVYSLHYGLIYGNGESIVPCLVSDIEILSDNLVFVTIVINGYESRVGVYEYYFGKTVFLTREEAEAKLKELNDDDRQ